MLHRLKQSGLQCIFILFSFMSIIVQAEDNVVVEDPSAAAMVTDLVLIRPVMLGVSIVGMTTYLVSLPFTLMGGNAKQAGGTLVVKPLKNTFVRCLGCTKAGYKKEIKAVEGI